MPTEEDLRCVIADLSDQCRQLDKEADWLTNQLHKTLMIDGGCKIKCVFGPDQWREAARKAVESPEAEAPTDKSGPKWSWASGGK